MRTAYRYLRNNGFEDMIVVDSGNGYHLLVRVSIAPKDNGAVKDFLLSLSAMFSDDKVDIDTANFNPSRITKVAGVMTSKGANTPDRPHRESKIIYIPPEIKKTDFPYIEKNRFVRSTRGRITELPKQLSAVRHSGLHPETAYPSKASKTQAA